MKKILALVLAMLVLLAIAGCRNADANNDQVPTTTEQIEGVTTTETPGDNEENTTMDWELPIDVETTEEETTEEVTTEEPEVTTTQGQNGGNSNNTTTEPATTVPETTQAVEPDAPVPDTTVTEPETTVPSTSGSSSGAIELPMIPG